MILYPKKMRILKFKNLKQNFLKVKNLLAN